MIDAVAILVSCFVLALVVLRAIRLDAALPWFSPLGGVKPAQADENKTVVPVPSRTAKFGSMLNDRASKDD